MMALQCLPTHPWRGEKGGWQQHTSSGWQAAGGDTSWANREQQARSTGQDRFSNFNSGGWGDRSGVECGGGFSGRFGESGGAGGGFGDRFGGGGFGDRFGEGGGFGGFDGGGFGGFRGGRR